MPKRHDWYRIQNAASEEEATVYIYDVIDSWFGVDAQALVRELAALDVERIHVRINSPGGSAFDGVAIYNALKRHPAEIVTHVDGWAASAASIIAMAGDEIRMGEGAFVMIHNAWGVAIGDADDMRQMADTLEKISDSIVGIYSRRTGNNEETVRAWMNEEKWFDAEEAIAAGFADAEEEGLDASATVTGADFLSRYKNVPRELAARARQAERPARGGAAPTERDAERALREAGFSNSAAKAIVARGYKATPEPRDEDGELAELMTALQQRGDTLATLATR